MGTKDIAPSEIESQMAVNFDVNSDLAKIPMPQFIIDGVEFDYRDIQTSVKKRTGAQWTLTSNMNYFHPFHVHVNPFQVKAMQSGYLQGSDLFTKAVIETNTVPPNMWRDTVFIPPLGSVIIWQNFGDSRNNSWTGKTVFHCHFYDHEDQGMIKAFLIAGPEPSE
mmetsp:Transcript_71610/g.168681  ORF Transcript_71610/g.168681 Transcript_71610/m.168681 type:complete len:165 (-) Transcript_71610:55-549(-)